MSTSHSSPRKTGALLIWGAVALVLIFIVVLAMLPKPKEAVTVIEEKAVPVLVSEVIPQEIADEIQLPARVEPLQKAFLAAERPGRVMELLADKGEAVQQNQVLLRFDRRLPEAAFHRAEIEERDAARDLARWKELEKAGAVSASEYEAVSRREESAAIALEEAKVILSQCEVCSPFEGVIVDRMVEVGDYASEGQPVLRLIRLNRVKIAFDVPEQDIATVMPGQEMTFTLAALPGREFSGTVGFVSSQASRDSNAFRVELESDNEDGLLKAGMIARVRFLRQMREGAVVVPLAAVVPRKGEHYVFVVENGRAVRKRVLIGAMLGHQAVLEDGVAAGDRVVIEGHRRLQDGQKVEIVEALNQTPPEAVEPAKED